ncbi:MAG: hypothetical protein MUC29_12360 [Pyrinomonadaceae bacterium]|jgi:23S rRNA U2552 (ribose-2'-O)-methylase RlmE/FtsJ|nr:hypothetical protein [Pyrinomonadaceae bacterium]
METLIIIQGTKLVDEYQNSENRNKIILNNYNFLESEGNILVKEFETKAEKEAYLQGFDDCEGWNKNHIIENEKAQEISKLLKSARIYIVKEDFYQEDMQPDCSVRLFTCENAYERAIEFLIETANARDTFCDFLKNEGDFRNKNLYWEIEEQTLEMWSAESIDVLETVQELGDYARTFSEIDYQEKEVDYGVTGYYFEKSVFNKSK